MSACPNCFMALREGTCFNVPNCGVAVEAIKSISEEFRQFITGRSVSVPLAEEAPKPENRLPQSTAEFHERFAMDTDYPLTPGCYVAVYDTTIPHCAFVGVGVIEARREHPGLLFVRFPGGRLVHWQRNRMISITHGEYIAHGGIPA